MTVLNVPTVRRHTHTLYRVEICALPGCNAAMSGNFVLTFRDNLLVHFQELRSRFDPGRWDRYVVPKCR